MKWFLDGLGKYAVFQGRSRRKEYWYFVLFVFLITILLTALDVLFGTYSHRYEMGLFATIFSVVTFVPWVALSVRRLHDIGYSGQWLWTLLIAVGLMAVDLTIGLVIFFVLSIAFMVAALVDSDSGANRYGPSPK